MRFTIPSDRNRHSEAREESATSDKAPNRREWGQRWQAFVRHRGQRYADCRLANFKLHGDAKAQERQRKMLADARRYAERMPDLVRQGKGLVAVGSVGAGKDHIVSAMARVAILHHGLDVAWTDGTAFYSQLRDAMTLDTTEGSMIRPLVMADVLYLSDPVPPAGTLSDYQKNMLFQLLDRRYQRGKPTWASCNFSNADEAGGVLGAPLADRLRHDALILSFAWPSYRKTAPRSGPEEDRWWEPFDEPDKPATPTPPRKPASKDPGGGFPIVTKYNLRNAESVENIFRDLVARGLAGEGDRRGVFQAAAQASLSSRQSPAERFRLLVEARAWEGNSKNLPISAKSAEVGDEMSLAERSKRAA